MATSILKDPRLRQAGAFISALLLALEVDSRRPKRDRRTALMLFEAIKKDGYTGGYSILTDYVRNWRNGLTPGSGKSAFVPLKFQLGEAFQFDWSEESLMIGGIHRKIQVAHTKLCASRAAYPTQTQEMLYDAHTKAFDCMVALPSAASRQLLLRRLKRLLLVLYLLHPCSRTTI